jgi:toxin YoeB
MRHIVFEGSAFQDFVEWTTVDNKMFQRIVHLILDTLRHPFSGLGKPEPLKHALRGYWSRRINQ